MPKQTYEITTDKGTYEIDVEVPESTIGPVPKGQPETYAGGYVKGLKEGVVGGAKGFLQGATRLAPYARGAASLVKAPFAIGADLLSAGGQGLDLLDKARNEGVGAAASDLANRVVTNVKEPLQTGYQLARGAGYALGLPTPTTSPTLHKAAMDPQGFGRDVGEGTAELEGGIAAGGLTKAAAMSPAIARGVGGFTEKAAHLARWPVRISGAHQLLGGNPIGGLALIAPEAVESVGRRLRELGEKDPAYLAKLAEKVTDIPQRFDPEVEKLIKAQKLTPEAEKLLRQQLSQSHPDLKKVDPKAERAAENDRKLAIIEDAAKGKEEGEPSIRRSLSAESPEGRMSMSVRIGGKPGAAVDPLAAELGLSPEDLATYRKAFRGDEDAIRKAVKGGGTIAPVQKAKPIGPVQPVAPKPPAAPTGAYTGPERRVTAGSPPEGIQERRNAAARAEQEAEGGAAAVKKDLTTPEGRAAAAKLAQQDQAARGHDVEGPDELLSDKFDRNALQSGQQATPRKGEAGYVPGADGGSNQLFDPMTDTRELLRLRDEAIAAGDMKTAGLYSRAISQRNQIMMDVEAGKGRVFNRGIRILKVKPPTP